MEEKKTSFLYKIVRWLVWVFYPKTSVVGAEKLPADEPVVLVGNHTQMNGPIVSEFYLPGRHYTWCAAEMMELGAVPAYAYKDFWSGKPRAVRWIFKFLSYVIAPLAVLIFNNAETIPVYHDARIIGTFRRSVAALQAGAGLVIFPEHAVPCNHILCEFQDKFIDVARFYYRKTKKALLFAPVYIAPAFRTAYIGKPIRFDPSAPIEDERRRLCDALMTDITAMADSLPLHTVVPYQNIPKKDYPKNHPTEVSEA